MDNTDDSEMHDDEFVEDPESKAAFLSVPPRVFRGVKISPGAEGNNASSQTFKEFRVLRWERLTIIGLLAIIIVTGSVLATTFVGGVRSKDEADLVDDTTSAPHFPGLTVVDLTQLCPEGATSFDPTKLPSNIFQRQGDYGAMIAAEVMDGVDLDPYSCSPQNLAILWMAANPPQKLLQDSLVRRYVLTSFYFSLQGWLWRRDDNWLRQDDECAWTGITCNEHGAVVGISLTHNNLKGALPEDLRLLTLLRGFDVSQNAITGTIPTALVKLPKLVELEVSLNDFTGTVPTELFKRSQMKILDFARFGGTIESLPTEIGNLSSLERLMVPSTSMMGSIPSELGRCKSLRFLDLSQNNLEGDIPTELGRLGNVQTLYLGGNMFDYVPDEVCSLMHSGRLLAFDLKAKCNT